MTMSDIYDYERHGAGFTDFGIGTPILLLTSSESFGSGLRCSLNFRVFFDINMVFKLNIEALTSRERVNLLSSEAYCLN